MPKNNSRIKTKQIKNKRICIRKVSSRQLFYHYLFIYRYIIKCISTSNVILYLHFSIDGEFRMQSDWRRLMKINEDLIPLNVVQSFIDCCFIHSVQLSLSINHQRQYWCSNKLTNNIFGIISTHSNYVLHTMTQRIGYFFYFRLPPVQISQIPLSYLISMHHPNISIIAY